MSTRLYLRNTSLNAGSYARTTKSAQLTNNFQDGGHAIRDLSLTKGASETSLVTATANSAVTQDLYWCKFISDPLAVSTIDQNIWTIALACAESSVNANMFIIQACCYVLASDDTIRGGVAVFDNQSNATSSAEFSTTEDGQVVTIGTAFTNAVTGVVSTDRLVFELCAIGSITMAGAYNITYWFNGATDVTGTTTTDAASYIETPQTITFGGGGGTVMPTRPDVLQWASGVRRSVI